MSPYLALAAALALWLVVVVVYALATRARNLAPGVSTPDLGAEPPAVVNLLVTRCELTADAADATLLDLAARHILELHQPGDDPAAFLVRVRVAEPADLTPYEQRVFDRVQALAPDRFVRVDELTTQLADGGHRWLRHLRKEVVADAKARGLVRERQFGTPLVLFTMIVAMFVACEGLVPVLNSAGDTLSNLWAFASIVGWFFGTVFILVALMMVLAPLLRQPGHTPAGRAAGAYWLGVARWLTAHEPLADLPPAAVAVWDRYLAYGVALGVNLVASHAVDLRAGRRGSVHSRYTGVPRLITVTYPRGPFAYSQAGVRLVTATLLLGGWIGLGFAVRSGTDWPGWLRWTLAALAAAGGLRSVYRLGRAGHAKLFPVTVTGQLLAHHPYNPQLDQESRWHQIVIDDGVSDRIRPWLMRTDRLGNVEVGAVVRIRAQPWTRYGLDFVELPAPMSSASRAGPSGQERGHR